MTLKIQILSLIFNFLFGIFYCFSFLIVKRFLLYGKSLLKFVFNFIFMIFNVFLYLFLLVAVNKGILHYYFIFVVGLGIFIGYLLVDKLRKKFT